MSNAELLDKHTERIIIDFLVIALATSQQCPLCKKDSERYPSCRKFPLRTYRTISSFSQHLSKYHKNDQEYKEEIKNLREDLKAYARTVLEQKTEVQK
jgi:hypothetical protein